MSATAAHHPSANPDSLFRDDCACACWAQPWNRQAASSNLQPSCADGNRTLVCSLQAAKKRVKNDKVRLGYWTRRTRCGDFLIFSGTVPLPGQAVVRRDNITSAQLRRQLPLLLSSWSLAAFSWRLPDWFLRSVDVDYRGTSILQWVAHSSVTNLVTIACQSTCFRSPLAARTDPMPR